MPHVLMTDPAHFAVDYVINPWMQPAAWHGDPAGNAAAARAAWAALAGALREAGARLEVLEGVPGLPDMVFPANAAVVLDGRALLARFALPQRQPEEARFRAALQAMRERGLLDEVLELEAGLVQEGAGDCLWDAARGHFWAGHGPRSEARAAGCIAEAFGREVVALELVSPRFYHLDVCFCPLPGGEVLYHPAAFSPAALRAIRERVPAPLRIEADAEAAARFCLNAVPVGRRLVMARPPTRLAAILAERGYRVTGLDLAPFILAGGAAACMTLPLDRRSVMGAARLPELAEG